MKGLKTLKPRLGCDLPDRVPGLPESAKRRLRGRPWERIRQQVLERDRYLCQECNRRGLIEPAAEIDHVVSLAQGGTDELSNLQSLCVPCHREKSKREGEGPRGGMER